MTADLCPGWEPEIERYTKWAHAAGHSRETIKLRRFWLFRLATRAVKPPFECNLEDLLDLLANPAWRPETRKTARNTIRSFYRYAVDTERVAADPSRRLPAVSIPRAVPRPAPEAIVAGAIVAAARKPEYLLMVFLAAFEGLRCCEIAALRTTDLVGDELYVRGKGGKLRKVPVLPIVAEMIRRFPAGYLFPGVDDGHWRAQSVSQRLGKILGPGWSAHKLRHRFASRAFAASLDIRAVQELLGHAKLETTQIYTAVPEGSLRKAVDGAASVAA